MPMKHKFWVFDLQSQFSWGKYCGKNCQWIVDNDPQYIVWIAKNMKEYSMRLKKPFVSYFLEKTGIDIVEIRKATGFPFRTNI